MMRHDTKDNKELAEFLDRPFTIDMLYPIYGKDSVETVFSGWTYLKKNSWHEFSASNGDILEFYPEGTYKIRWSNRNRKVQQLKTPITIDEFVGDMDNMCI